MSGDWKNDIFTQKGLWDVYLLSREVLPKSKFNKIVIRVSALIFVSLFIWSILEGKSIYTASEAVSVVRVLAEQCFVLSLGILGFLIAGFAIFASVTKTELFITLANIRYQETKINRLQFVFFNFLNVFTVYIGLLSASLFVLIALAEHSPLIKFAYPLVKTAPALTIGANFIVIGVLGVWLVSAIVKLKSFIWNLYQTVLVSIATEAELKDRTGDSG